MRFFSVPTLASVSVLALGLIAVPVTIDVQKGLISTQIASAKGNGHGGDSGGGNGHSHGQDKAGKSTDSEVSSADTTDESEDVQGEEEESGLPSKAIENKTNSSAYHSANAPDPNATENTDSKAPNPNSAVSYSRAPTETPEEPTGNDPTAEEPTGEDPVDATPGVVEDEPSGSSGEPTTSSL